MMARISGSGGGGCFLGHTLVRTPDGHRAIETLQPGDLVVSFDDQGQLHHAKVLKVHEHEGERVVRYRLWGGKVLDATPNHWVLNQYNAFVEIGTLGPDDCVVDENEHLRPIVERLEFCVGTVYNLTVEGHHTFIAGGVRVHNAGLGAGKISGSGGGGGGKGGGGGGEPYKPTTEQDGLVSTQYAQLIDLISEGEIEGLKDGPCSIFVNNTPLAAGAIAGTYSQVGPAITVTSAGHGLAAKRPVYLRFTSGAAVTGIYNITAVTTDTFTVSSEVSATTSGSLTWAKFNYRNLQVYTRNGTQSQTAIPIASTVENVIAVNTEVLKGLPVTRTITDPDVDAARVTITVPQLQSFTDKGDILGAQVTLRIEVQYNAGGYQTAITNTIKGRTGDAYQREYLVELTGEKPVDIRVVRVSSDSTDPKYTNAFSWTSYTEVINAKLRYPNSALVGIRIDARQFSSIPSRTYQVRGIKVVLPQGATVDSATGAVIYNDIWTGTFGAAQWCSDPAWILWDLLTARYGFGDQINAAQLDKWAFYAASQYCSALNTYTDPGEIAARAAKGLPPRTGATNDYHPTTGRHGVPDGFGGYEPRFSCNVNIQTAEDAYKLINDLCSVFRAMPYWGAGALTASQDKPSDPAYLFTLANVSEDGFSYQSSAQKTRPSVAVVSYLDLNTREIAYEVVEDQEAIAKYGVVTTQVSAFACTSRGQAARLGEWLLYAEQYESEVISFTASIDAGVIVRPGQVIEVADPMRAGARRGGRLTATTASVLTVDDATGLPSSGGTVSAIMPDGTVEQRVMTSRTGNALSVDPAFSAAPNPYSVWIYQSAEIEASTWRVLAVQEQDGSNYLVNALKYDASKYDYIERDRPLQARDTSNLNELPAAPTDLELTEALYEYQGQVRAKVIASWKAVLGVPQYQVRWRKDDGNWTVVEPSGPDYEVLDITPGSFDFEVYSVSPAFKLSATGLTGTINALGKTAAPSDVTGLTYTADKDLGVLLTWNPIPDIDADQYEIRRGADWGSATVITQVKATSYKVGYLDDGTYTYLVKAIDTSGVYSTSAVGVAVVVASPNATTISSTIEGTDLVLNWTVPTTTTYAIAYYRVTYGSSYATSTELAKTQSTSFKVPITWSGDRTFYVVPVDLVGKFSDPPDSELVTISGAAATTITTTVGGSTATLSWTAVAGTLPTASYEIRYGGTFATATILANITATTYTLRATWTGAQTFWVVAKDINGNYGTAASAVITVNTAGAPALASSFSGQNVVFTWPPIKGTLDTDYYLLKRGATWAGATTVATIYSTAYTLKADWSGSQRFWIAAVDVNGAEGTPDDLDVIVTAPSAPTLTQQVIDNNVLLRWNDVTQTLPILSYELRRGSTWAGATVIGTKQGGFTTVFETQAGTYTYWLAGIDSAGNYGTPSGVSAVVNQPPDYVLQLNQNSSWAGTETNIYTDAALGQIVNVNTSETWEGHFTSRSWTTPQDQIDAGYTYFLMPSTTTAAYVEEFDYGTVLAGTKVTATLTSTNVVGSTTITPTISVRELSTDPWTDYAGLSEVFATQFRYFKVRYDFASSGGNDLLLLNSLNVRLDSKQRSDAGSGTANSGDSGGTTVNFNVSFVDVQSITVTPLATTGVIAVYDFTDAPNPTSFKVLLFDTSGTRVTGGFSWTARGV